MEDRNLKDSTPQEVSGQRFGQRWRFALCSLVVLIAFLLPWIGSRPTPPPDSTTNAVTPSAGSTSPGTAHARPVQRRLASQAARTADEVVASKVSQFARDRRGVVHAIALHFKVEVPAEVERFFAAAETGNWDEVDSLAKSLRNGTAGSADLAKLWPAVLETWGVAEQAHEWPAQKLLDYGNAILGSLRLDMVYVGGTDPGRFIPTLLNETSEGDRRIVLTQNGLADGSYVEYFNFLYGDRLNSFTPEDSQRVFQDYISDAQKRLEHDQQFPEEPKQIRFGEDVKNIDGRIQVSGQAAVMAINERLLLALMEKNPDASFALEESFPLKSTYADAVPLGPIMELGVQDGQNAFNAEQVAQSLDYWRTIAQQLLLDPEASGSPETLKTYSHMAVAQANLLAAHDYGAEAEEAYRVASRLWPGNPESVSNLSDLMFRTGRADEARQLVEDFARKYPDQRSALEAAASWRLVAGAQTPP
jgi:tetratricopeptide (TPR) repeat protein